MLPPKKKLLTKQTPNIPAKKKLPPLPVDDEIDESEVDDEAVEVEAPLPKKKLVPKHIVEEDDEEVDEDEVDEVEEEVLPKKKANVITKKKSALAKAFDSVPLSNSADDIPAGKHEAIIREAVVQPFSEDKGQSIRFKYEFCNPNIAGKQLTQWFKIIDANGAPVDWMIDMLKKSLAKLGIEIEGNDLEDTIQEIHDARPGVVVKLTYSRGNDGNIYPRPVIQGPCDSETVETYRDNIPY